MESTVRFLGHRGDVPDVLSAMNIAVCCSDFEGCPLAILEYMEAALPVVSTAVGGIPDLIAQDVHGLLVPPAIPTPWLAPWPSSLPTRRVRGRWELAAANAGARNSISRR
jgi:glycosyltransferase involved in cell wall biosynthesis